MSARVWVLIGIGVLFAVVAAVFVVRVGSDDGDDDLARRQAAVASVVDALPTPPSTAVEHPPEVIQIVGGKPAGGVRTIDAGIHDYVRFQVITPTSSEEIVITGPNPTSFRAGVNFTWVPGLVGAYEARVKDTGELLATLTIHA